MKNIKIKKQATGETFDLPEGYVIESEQNSPLFMKKGSQTVPILFPPSGNNRRLMEYPERLDKADKALKQMTVVVESGTVSKKGILAVGSAGRDAISANIGWDESLMYANMGEIMLRDIKGLPVVTVGGSSASIRVDLMLSWLTRVMKEESDADYFVFPVVLKKEWVNDSVFFEVLNDISDYTDQGTNGELLALESRTLIRVVEGKTVKFDVPKGYGVSPFLKVWRILELVFSSYGLTLENNPFKEHRQLKKLVMLNNTMDAILTGSLYYKDMMPDITVEKFFSLLYNKFGLQYFIDSSTNKVHLYFLRDIFLQSGPELIDCTRFKTAPANISYTGHKQLKIIQNRDIEGTEIKTDTFEDFLKAYAYQFIDTTDERFNSNYSSIFNAEERAYFIKDLNGQQRAVSSDFFNWDKKAGLAYEEIKQEDLSLPLGKYKHLQLFYLIGYKHAYSDVSVLDEIVEEGTQNEALPAFAFGWGRTSLSSPYVPEYFFASQDNRDWWGRFIYDASGVKYDISLQLNREDGLFNRFWKEYDTFLRHSAYEVNAELDIPEYEKQNIHMYRPILFEGQPLLAEQIKEKMNGKNTICNCKFRTLRPYRPYNLEEEQKIETYAPQNYYWRRETVKIPNIEEILDEMGIEFTYEGDESAEDAKRQSLLWLPPTEEEYVNGKTRVYEYDYFVIYTEIVPHRDPVHAVSTYYPEHI